MTISIPEPVNPQDLIIEPPIPEVEPEPVHIQLPPPKPEPTLTETLPAPAPRPQKPETIKTDPGYEFNLSPAEQKARTRFLRWIGGEEALERNESDISAARTAAAAALEKHDLSLSRVPQIAIIDFTKPSYLKRMMLYNPQTGYATRHLVAHGVKSGSTYAKNFSNSLGSNKSSAGLYWVGDHYRGKHGKSIRLHGMDKGTNDRAYRRAIVLHAAWYVSYATMSNNLTKEKMPRIGRSLGCPSIHTADLSYVLGKLKRGTYIYIYTGDK